MPDLASIPAVPAPTRASLELPDLEALRRYGIPLDLEWARLVACLLSRLICAGEAEQRHAAYVVARFFQFMCALPYERFGVSEPPAHPDLAEVVVPAGETAMRRLGVDNRVLVEYRRVTKNRCDDSCLPVEWLIAFAPGEVWPLFATVIGWGPERAAAHVEEALIVMARQEITRPTRRRAAGSKLAAGTLRQRVSEVWKLMDVLVELRAAREASLDPVLPGEPLARWQSKPPRPDVKALGALDSGLDNSGPPFQECGRRLAAIERRFAKATPGSRYLLERKRLLAALCPLYGIREAALARIAVDDYLPAYVLADGVRGPVLRIYPGKNRSREEAYYLPLPLELAGWIERWIATNGFEIGEQGVPLFPSTRGDGRAFLTPNAIYALIAGRENSSGSGSLALLPFSDDNPYLGWWPHSFRHTAYGLAERAGALAKLEEPIQLAGNQPSDFATAICGHLFERSVRNTYRDVEVHRLARAAAERGWELLRDAGVRKGLDPAAIEGAREALERLTTARRLCQAELQRASAELDRLNARSAHLTGDTLYRAAITSHKLQADVTLLADQLNRLDGRIGAAHQQLDDALARMVAIPDDRTDVEHDLLVRAAQGFVKETLTAAQGPLADELPVADLALVFATEPQTVNRWYRDGFPRRTPTYWDNDAWIVHGPRSKRLPVAAIDLSTLTPAQREHLNEVRRRRGLESVDDAAVADVLAYTDEADLAESA
jgi:hypothetical protein